MQCREEEAAAIASEFTPASGVVEGDNTGSEVQAGTEVGVDKDLLCPICIQLMKDAFLTSCGHSFCYMCIMTHLKNRSTCPCCGAYLTSSQLYPNFLLNKMLKKVFVSQLANKASPAEYLLLSLKQGAEISLKEINSLLLLLNEKKQKIEQEETETNMEILLAFLNKSKHHKQHELNEMQVDLRCLREDIAAVENQLMELRKSKDDQCCKLLLPRSRGLIASMLTGTKENVPRRDTDSSKSLSVKRSMDDTLTEEVVSKKRRVTSQFKELQQCYLQKRRQSETDSVSYGSFGTGLEDFQNVLAAFMRYSQLRVVAEVRHPDLFHSNIVSSIEFDRDDEFFATAGFSRRIKVFEYASVTSESDIHYPVMEMASRARLSCLSWNKAIKHHIASSDYEGIVTIWDTHSGQSVMELEEHEKRAWSVDFSPTDPSMLVSGGDDGMVKIWSTRQENSVLGIEMKANVCSVKFNPGSSNFVAIGSADQNVHYYDIRKAQAPVYTFAGHRKAVSYVKFMSANELASASTDSTLRLWDVKTNRLISVFTGHANERNFVGMSVNNEYLTCGSETNEVYVYHKAIPKPATSYRFEPADDSEYVTHFITAVCWKSDNLTMLAASSQGTIKVLSMAS